MGVWRVSGGPTVSPASAESSAAAAEWTSTDPGEEDNGHSSDSGAATIRPLQLTL